MYRKIKLQKLKQNQTELIFDFQIDEQMKDAIQKGCSEYAPGIEIIGVRVTKPNIPASIKRNFEQMEEERTKVYVS